MDKSVLNLIFQAIDQTITEADFERLQNALEQDPEVCDAYRRAVDLCESLGELSRESSNPVLASMGDIEIADQPSSSQAGDRPGLRFSMSLLAFAATVMILVSAVAFSLGRWNQRDADTAASSAESRIAGHATLRRAVDLQWSNPAGLYREGDVLANGTLAFDGGIAEIDFFCGATLIIEGPARLEIESDWSVRVAEGKLRANVPPAARGFIVKAADSEIIDLGTEFALEVRAEHARVEVIDGEVKLRGGAHSGKHLLTGDSQSLKGKESSDNLVEGLSSVSEFLRRREQAKANRFAEWKTQSQALQNDPRLIAYFPIAASQSQRRVSNLAGTGEAFDGLLIGPVERTQGRFGSLSAGLEFDRPGSRVRTRIDGEFEAFTFACWARIDSLEHRYNALFMADGYENGEPHWQIRNDGSLMFSVMVDDTQEIRHFSEFEQRVVAQAGLHRVYYTQPFWDISDSGQWFHLAAVYDPINRRISQYVDGKRLSSEKIIDKFHITQLRIGAGEIGNWGQPSRKTPSFAIRNLNGTIDELAIFNAALDAKEINDLYEQGKPLGY